MNKAWEKYETEMLNMTKFLVQKSMKKDSKRSGGRCDDDIRMNC